MSPRRRPSLPTTGLAALACLGLLTLSACDSGRQAGPSPAGAPKGAVSTPPPPPGPVIQPVIDRGIDARGYVRDYAPAMDAAGANVAGALSPSAVPSSAVRGPQGGTNLAGPVELPTPAPLTDNTFVDAGTSGFTGTDTDARSTFALDVDTGSYDVARALLRQGQRPPPASIRVEEWVNALSYPDPAPTDGADLGLSTQTGPAPSAEGTQLVRVAVRARDVSATERAPVNVTLVVDRSGSMDIRQRLGLVQSSLAVLANRLRGDDTVSVVGFGDRARAILAPTPVRETDAILAAIDELRPGGSTNLEAGLRLGYRTARESLREDGVNVVVLCSDGVANVGHTGPGSLVEEIREQGLDGIHLVTAGYGLGNYDDHLMEQLADLGDGFYAHLNDYADAESLFGTRLSSVLTPVADDAKAQVVFDPATVSSYRLIGYDNRALADAQFDDPGADAGELGAGHAATALYEVRLASGVEPGSKIGTASLRWDSVADGSAQEASSDVLAAVPVRSGAVGASDSLRLAATVADLAQLLKGGGPLAERDTTLGDLRVRAQDLVEGGVPGADAVLTLVRQAQRAVLAPEGGDGSDGPPLR